MAQCVFCESATNLNTQILISLEDGKKATVDICDEHADDATPKTAKAAYLKRQDEAVALIAKLKALGFEVTNVEQKGQLIVPTVAKPKPAPVPIVESFPETDLEGEGVVDTALLDSKSRGIMSASRSANYGGGAVSVAGYASFDATAEASRNIPPDQRPLLLQARKGKAKMVVTEGREGQQLLIPEKRVDGMGTTRLKITKREDDTKLQSRFKRMAKDSVDHGRVPNFAREGYQNTQTDCPFCRGACVIVHNNREISCPKCNGAGIISVY